jgi:hypothetical protein
MKPTNRWSNFRRKIRVLGPAEGPLFLDLEFTSNGHCFIMDKFLKTDYELGQPFKALGKSTSIHPDIHTWTLPFRGTENM